MTDKVVLGRAPVTDDELWQVVRSLWGVAIPRVRVCEGHCAPFTAFADAYFARDPWYLWYGSRGTGKSLLLALLGLTAAAVDNVDVTLLGGSMAQSQNVQEHIEALLRYRNAPTYSVSKQIKTEILFNAGNWIRPLPASQKTVRGPHPSKTLLDEIDEMDYDVYTAAQGQAMEKGNALGVMHREVTVASSTWQNPIGCVIVDTIITTAAGDKRIQDVEVGDLVPTRGGWMPVSEVHDTGVQPVVRVSFASGKELFCTPWHPVLTQTGFVEASRLLPGFHVGSHFFDVSELPLPLSSSPALTTPVTAGEVVTGKLVTVAASVDEPVSDSHFAASSVVLGDCHGFEMSGVDTGSDPAQMVDDQSFTYRSVDLFPDPSMREDDSGGSASVGLSPVPVFVDVQGPEHTFVGIEGESVAFEDDLVVSVGHSEILAPTHDLTVMGSPEYVAAGVLVHNTFQKVIDDARAKGRPIRTWCFNEVLKPHGWMEPDFIERKRLTVPAEMFRTEYLLGEPSASSRAFDSVKLEEAFINLGTVDARDAGDDVLRVFEGPVAAGMYAAGADWAKENDHTVIVVFRTDVLPARCVYFRRIRRHPWPVMISMFNETVRKYHAASAHDATGLGNVVTDLVSERTTKVVMVGNERTKLLTSYISAVEQGVYRLPRNSPAYDAHRACTAASVFYPGRSGSHLPDEVAAFALAHRAAGDSRTVASGESVLKIKDDPNRSWVQKLDWPPEQTDESRLEGMVEEKDVGGVGAGAFWSV